MSNIRLALAAVLLLLTFSASAEQLNLNTADADALAEGIAGIGPAKAAAIVAYRDRHGPFKSVDDLLLVKGIGAATLKKNRQHLTAAST